MNINVAFGKEAGGEYHLSFDPAEKEHVQSGLLLAHIWNMSAWVNKAQRALELYARDRAAHNENHIGNRDLVLTCDELAHLWQDVEWLKDNAGMIMNKDYDVTNHAMGVCERYSDLQIFLQPILWTDHPRSIMHQSLHFVDVA
jgi:hypothetical protein